MIREDFAHNHMRCCGPEGCGRLRKDSEGNPQRYCITSQCMAWIKTDRIQAGYPNQPHKYVDVGQCGLCT